MLYRIVHPDNIFRKTGDPSLKRNTQVSIIFYYTESFRSITRNLNSHVIFFSLADGLFLRIAMFFSRYQANLELPTGVSGF